MILLNTDIFFFSKKLIFKDVGYGIQGKNRWRRSRPGRDHGGRRLYGGQYHNLTRL